MKSLEKVIQTLTTITKYIALTTMTLMMLFIAIAVFSRLFFSPIIGDIEIVQLGMVVMIMCGLAYTQQVNGHITIEIIADKLPVKAQTVLDIVGALLTFLVTLTFAFIYLGVALDHQNHMRLSTNLLDIPFYPFDYIIVLGLFMWGLEALLKVIRSCILLFQSKSKEI
ncbi:TRAP transporter small permease [Cytobacillus purgationiresistens]|uniref:TRAP-type C4-dicarboxylate transport system permease small subunit n=1 Tax=Cytobacillus purgationiresistens TaxID=863449 RepID=A0ABU0AF81_9BACI|nr:TRAP transporter small permease [Cytobacillus purgationiresistens]MDQ0269685.1 TRAP-type C4-dicarboxylate transport system permease small subunit [Cytobacillus purgationiresistens]